MKRAWLATLPWSPCSGLSPAVTTHFFQTLSISPLIG